MNNFTPALELYKGTLRNYLRTQRPGFTYDDVIKNITFTISPKTGGISPWIHSDFVNRLTKQQHKDLLQLCK
jgi:hypothetical protein